MLDSNVINRLPVVNKRRKLVGIVTSSDLISELLRNLPLS